MCKKRPGGRLAALFQHKKKKTLLRSMVAYAMMHSNLYVSCIVAEFHD